MKKHIIILLVISGFAFSTFAQDKEKSEPVYAPFESPYLIDQQTTVIPDVKTLEFVIQHKFGSVDNGVSDIWGIYSSANVRLALDYVPVKDLQLGIGLTRNKMYTDLNAKWNIWKQTTDNSMPVSVALYGSVAINGQESSDFGTGKVKDTKDPNNFIAPVDFTFFDRFSYYSQLIVGRKITDALSVQAGASFTHYNMVGWDYDHDVVSLHFNGRAKISSQASIIATYDAPLKIKNISEQTNWDTHAKPSLALGIELSTYTHAFQIYVGNANGILPQDNLMFNRNKFNKEGIAFGFTMTRLWMF